MRAWAVVLVVLSSAASVAAADRTKPPVPGPVRPLVVPAEERLTLSNGLAVHLVAHREVPVAEIVLVVRAGAAADPDGRDGVASMTVAMLDEGAGGRGALEIADEVDFLGAELETSSAWDHSAVRLRIPVTRLEAGLAILADVALRPDFPEAELVRLRKEALTEELQARDAPGAIGQRALQHAVFGKAHRYGRPIKGDSSSLAALTISDMKAFHSAHYRPSRSSLVVVGDVTASILPVLEKAFGGWTGKAGALPSVAEPGQLASRSLILVDKPGAVQSSLRLGRVGPARVAPDYHAAEVMNTLLGGSFTSRLNDNLREQHGYTYGARSRIQRNRVGGTFLVGTDVESKVSAAALSEVMKELERIGAPPPAADLERARNYLALRYVGEFESTQQLASKIAERIVYDLPLDFHETFVPKALTVSGADLERAGKAIADPTRLAIVVVGDRKSIEAPLDALGLGALTVLSIEDVMGKPPRVE